MNALFDYDICLVAAVVEFPEKNTYLQGLAVNLTISRDIPGNPGFPRISSSRFPESLKPGNTETLK
jgi:hypothetical protein